jgi:hypothetical protein
MVTHGLCVETLATGRTVCAQIGTKEHVVSVVGHGGKLIGLVRPILTDSVSYGKDGALNSDKIPAKRNRIPCNGAAECCITVP